MASKVFIQAEKLKVGDFRVIVLAAATASEVCSAIEWREGLF